MARLWDPWAEMLETGQGSPGMAGALAGFPHCRVEVQLSLWSSGGPWNTHPARSGVWGSWLRGGIRSWEGLCRGCVSG